MPNKDCYSTYFLASLPNITRLPPFLCHKLHDHDTNGNIEHYWIASNTTIRTSLSSAQSTIKHRLLAMASIRKRPNTQLQNKISQMRLKLAPIYPLPSGPPHPAYPKTLLHYWLLTESQLDALAQYYHQISPGNPWRLQYPACMNWDRDFLAVPHSSMGEEERRACLSPEERLAIKRRMFGKFIGLRGCETPMIEVEQRVKLLERKLKLATTRATKWPSYF
ncbi:hypothetical protein, variant [Verruconis gallopava]|uniref:Uncharacterized protein n=1 Tax=Verruconis gallopava TaxID=253628 RepID=A0A0D2AMF2_9PEZI|nr:uncharacterized protein PV09_01832 [Verruconis gallopava]XP_016217793.1 hypothetical protein, variant [Verruconis gallopava]KIW07923.1 hypothetical protein PV09_01832 [Verruconis gallopava]KIW07924.1 hypothetical protein, variant [Verruconis gallopava]